MISLRIGKSAGLPADRSREGQIKLKQREKKKRSLADRWRVMVNISCNVMNVELTPAASRFQPEDSGKVGIDVAVNQVFVQMNARLLKADSLRSWRFIKLKSSDASKCLPRFFWMLFHN